MDKVEHGIFEIIRKEVARRRNTAQWAKIGETREELKLPFIGYRGPDLVVYEAVHPGLVACRLYAEKEELELASKEVRGIRKNKLKIRVAVSREMTGASRVHVGLSRRYIGRAELVIDLLYALVYGNYDPPLRRPHPLGNIAEEFSTKFPEIARTFQGLEASLAQPFRNLVGLPRMQSQFGHIIETGNNKRYDPQKEGEFLFIEQPLRYTHGSL